MTSEIANDFIVNPYTGRLIKKGSKTYERLLNARLLNEDKPSTSEENVVMHAESNDQENRTHGYNTIKKPRQITLN